MFFVYVDCKPDGTPFYVGKGALKRLHLKQRNKHHTNICAKYPDWYRGLAFMGSEQDAFAKEIELIAKYKNTLTNYTNGGEGISGLKKTKESIQKSASFHIGRKRSQETKQKLSERLKGNTNAKGTIHTAETKAKISAGRKGIVNIQPKYLCLECGLIANNGNLTQHHKFKNHAGKALL